MPKLEESYGAAGLCLQCNLASHMHILLMADC